MGYIEKVMGDRERALYRTHLHFIVLLQRIAGSFFAWAVFLGIGLIVLLTAENEVGDKIRFTVGLIVLGSLVLPLYLIAAPWLRGLRGRELLERVWKPALAMIPILAVALALMFSPEFQATGWAAIALALIPFFELIRQFLDWLNERYIITNRRVMEIRGIINKHIRDSALEKVNDVDMTQSFVGRLLGYGTVQIITGSDIGVNMFRRISNPVRFKREMLNAKEQLHGVAAMDDLRQTPVPARAEGEAGPTTEATPPTRANITDLLVELAELHQKGILSEEEFQAKKKELLDRL